MNLKLSCSSRRIRLTQLTLRSGHFCTSSRSDCCSGLIHCAFGVVQGGNLASCVATSTFLAFSDPETFGVDTARALVAVLQLKDPSGISHAPRTMREAHTMVENDAAAGGHLIATPPPPKKNCRKLEPFQRATEGENSGFVGNLCSAQQAGAE